MSSYGLRQRRIFGVADDDYLGWAVPSMSGLGIVNYSRRPIDVYLSLTRRQRWWAWFFLILYFIIGIVYAVVTDILLWVFYGAAVFFEIYFIFTPMWILFWPFFLFFELIFGGWILWRLSPILGTWSLN
jgi:hypothetical protein